MTTILVIDDGATARELAVQLLEEKGYRVVALDGPMGAAEVVRDEKPALVLVDVGMPTMSGDDVVRYLRRDERFENIPILFYSAKDAEELAALVKSSGAQGYVEKRAAREDLVFTVRGFIGDPQ